MEEINDLQRISPETEDLADDESDASGRQNGRLILARKLHLRYSSVIRTGL